MYKKTAIYARISVRHLKRKEGSIQSQIQCCKSWIIKEMPKETAYQVYVDEGYSGKDFFRPAWQQLIRDCQNGKINCLLVRDLSRMGRDYLQVGEYMERFFPGHQIRLVAIANRYDSDRYDCYFGTYALKNFFNEWYRKDIAGKVSLVKAEQKKEGSFLGSHARYGYTIVSYRQKRILVANETIIIRFIICFLSVRGYRSTQIVSWLYRHRVSTPSEYEKTKHMICQKHFLTHWNDAVIRKIIKQGI